MAWIFSKTAQSKLRPDRGRPGPGRSHRESALASLRAWIAVLAGLTSAAGAAPALAQKADPPSALASQAQASPQQLNPAAAVPARQRPRGDVLGAPEPGPCPLAAYHLSFTLTSVQVTGADKMRPTDFEPAYRQDLNRQIGLDEVCAIRDRLGLIFFRKGLLARVEVPEQRIQSGQLQLKVIEAHVVSVQVRGDAGPAQEQVEVYLAKLRGMKPFDIHKAQRYLLLASDIPGVRLSAALRPAAGGLGAVDLVVFVSRKPVDVLANVQNFGSRELGPVGATARADFNGFSRYGERNSLILYSTVGNPDQRVVEMLSEARLGGEGLTIHGSASYGVSQPGAELAPLALDGRSLVVNGGLTFPLIRSRGLNLNLGAGLDVIEQRTVYGLGGLLSDDHLRVVDLHMDGQQMWRVDSDWLQGATLAGEIDLRRGLEALGASRVGQPALSRIGGRADGTLVRGDAHLDLALPARLTLRALVTGQYSPDDLLAYEQFAVGDMTIGRGYDPSFMTGDQGVGGTLELRAGAFEAPSAWKWPAGVAAAVFAFYDTAAVFNHAPGAIDWTVHSAGAGLDLQLTPRAHLSATYAYPFDRTTVYAGSPPPPRLLVSLTTSFL